MPVYISYEPLEQRFEIHSILSELLVMKRKERGEAFERECLKRAGDYCREEGNTPKALEFYFSIGDYEQMLSLDLSPMALETIGDMPFFKIARSIARNCPYTVKRGHILSMLQVAWALLMSGLFPEFDALMQELKDMLDECSGEDASSLLGEWMILFSFKDFPNTGRMTEVLRQAALLLKGQCSQVILPAAPWCFGSYSPLAVYHVHPGEADREADALEEYVTVFSKLTNGNGRGADVLYRAELAFHRGDLNNAEILAYKAEFLAKSKQQGIVQLGAAVLLGDIALRKADATGWQYAISSMESAVSCPGQNTSVAHSTLDIARGMLFNELRKQKSIATWLQNGELSQHSVLPPHGSERGLCTLELPSASGRIRPAHCFGGDHRSGGQEV
jgi:LuxR family maltose regulon positive regulatory protein